MLVLIAVDHGFTDYCFSELAQ